MAGEQLISPLLYGIVYLLVAVMGWLIGSAVLHYASKLVLKKKNLKFKTALTVMAIQAGVMFIFNLLSLAMSFLEWIGIFVSLALLTWLIKEFYKLKQWGKALLVALVCWLIEMAVVFVLLFGFVAILVAMGATLV